MSCPQGLTTIRQRVARPQCGRQRILQLQGQLLQHTVDQPAKLFRRQRADALVDRNDAASVNAFVVVPLCVADQLILRVRQPQAARLTPFHLAVERDPLP